MTEGEVIRFYKKRNRIKSHKLVKEKKVALQNWGVFEKRKRKARKVLMPMWEEAGYTEPKEAVKFRAGKSLIEIANGDTNE